MMRLVSMVFAAMLLAATHVSAATGGFLSQKEGDRLATIPHDAALESALEESGLDRVAVRHDGWNETLVSWSRIKIDELTGRSAIHGQDPVYTVLSMMYEPQRWADAKFLPVEHPRIAEILKTEGKWISPRMVLENEHIGDLRKALADASELEDQIADLKKKLDAASQVYSLGKEKPNVIESVLREGLKAEDISPLVRDETLYDNEVKRLRTMQADFGKVAPFMKAGNRLLSRTMQAFHLRDEFFLVPDVDSVTGSWLNVEGKAPEPMGPMGMKLPEGPMTSTAPTAGASAFVAAMRELDAAFTRAFAEGQAASLPADVARFLGVVEKSRAYPTESYRARKNLYTLHSPYTLAAYTYALATALLGLFAFFRRRALMVAGVSVFALGFALHTAGGVLRFLLTGHMPVSNMYESITFAAWAAMLIGLIFELVKRRGIFGLVASSVGTIMMMGVTMMPLYETRLHPLRAVLNSYWLNIHVTAMLVSYGTFAVAAVFGVTYLVKSAIASATGRESLIPGKAPLMSLDQTEEFAYRLIQVGWPILTVGVCLGAVWADTAWGRYWGWDPKETWALITWIVYTIYLHSRMVMGWKGRVSAIACVVGFLMVMITWLGVSYLPGFAGGLHTYASPK